MDSNANVRTTWGHRISTSKLALSATTNIRRSIIIYGNIKRGVNRLNAVQKATYLKKIIKSGKNEECTVTVKTATDQ